MGGLPPKGEYGAKDPGHGEVGTAKRGRGAEEQDRGNGGGACGSLEGVGRGDNPQLDVSDLQRESE